MKYIFHKFVLGYMKKVEVKFHEWGNPTKTGSGAMVAGFYLITPRKE